MARVRSARMYSEVSISRVNGGFTAGILFGKPHPFVLCYCQDCQYTIKQGVPDTDSFSSFALSD